MRKTELETEEKENKETVTCVSVIRRLQKLL